MLFWQAGGKACVVAAVKAGNQRTAKRNRSRPPHVVRGVAQIRCSAVQNVWPKSAPNFGAPNGVMSFSVMFIMGKAVTPLLGQKKVPKILRFLASKMLHIGDRKKAQTPPTPTNLEAGDPTFRSKKFKTFWIEKWGHEIEKNGNHIFCKRWTHF